MKKIRMTVYLEPKTYDQLRAYAGSRRQPLSVMAEAAVAAFVDPEQKEAGTTRRLGRIERQLERLARDTNISVEAFMVYVWLWLGANPPFPSRSPPPRARRQPNATTSSWKPSGSAWPRIRRPYLDWSAKVP